MCVQYTPRLRRGQVKPGDAVPLVLADGTETEGVWAGCAQEEKLEWWLKQPGNQLAQGEEVTEITERADDNEELLSGPAPEDAHLLFVLEPAAKGKSYALAKMITTTAQPDQVAYFRHDRTPLLGELNADGKIIKTPSAPAPPPRPPSGQLGFGFA